MHRGNHRGGQHLTATSDCDIASEGGPIGSRECFYDRRRASLIGEGKIRSEEGFYTLEEGFNASEGVLTKFQVNLVIPKALFIVIFQPKEGICIYGGFLICY